MASLSAHTSESVTGVPAPVVASASAFAGEDQQSSLDPLQSITGALIDANDRLLGLISLTEVAGDSLDEATAVQSLLASSLPLLQAESAEFEVANTSAAENTSPTNGARHRFGLSAADRGPHQVEVMRHDAGTDLTLRVWRHSEPFGTPERKLLDGVANLLANAVRTARMHRVGMSQALMAREHAAAARLTAAVLPNADEAPKRSGVSTFARLTPARTTGGDLYAWDLIDDHLWFAVGDVSGKGLPAAVQMTTIMSAVSGGFARHHARGVAAVFDFVERMVFDNLSEAGMFVTLTIGRVLAEPSAGAAFTVEIANAGHSPVVFATGGTARRVDATAPPVGVLAGVQPLVETLDIGGAAALVIATDGFTEQEDGNGQAFGEDTFDDLVNAICPASAPQIGNRLFAELDKHTNRCEQSDDRTLFVLSFEP